MHIVRKETGEQKCLKEFARSFMQWEKEKKRFMDRSLSDATSNGKKVRRSDNPCSNPCSLRSVKKNNFELMKLPKYAEGELWLQQLHFSRYLTFLLTAPPLFSIHQKQ